MKKFLSIFWINMFIFYGSVFSQVLENAPYYPMVGWDTSPYHSLKVTGGTANPTYNMTFRLLYPKNYDATSVSTTNYPIMVMLHGRGESALGNGQFGVYGPNDPRKFNNDHQLVHHGREYLNAVNAGTWPGFVMFPQNSYGDWLAGASTLADVVEIIETISKTLKIDPNRIFVSGLSAGAHAVWASLARYPKVFAGGVAYSGISNPSPDNTTKIVHIPLWYFQGEVDPNPDLVTADRTMQAIKNIGGTPTYTVYPETGHGTWYKAIAEPDFFPFLKRHSKTSIHIFFGKTQFDLNEPVNVKLGVTPGFDGYEWRKDGVLISEANSNEIMATSLGSYTVRILRGTIWTEWSTPAVLKLKTPPSITKQPSAQIKSAGNSATFSVTVAGTPPFNYQWQKDQVNIPNANSSTYFIPNCLMKDAGSYRVIVSNTMGEVVSNQVSLSITPSLAVAIHSPVTDALFKGGETISYSGDGNDSRGGVLPESAFTWTLQFRKPNGTITEQWKRTGSKEGSFNIPTVGIGNNDYYRLILTAKDVFTGATKTLNRDIKPKLTELGIVTIPEGFSAVLDGKTITTPYYFIAVEGMERTIRAITPQTLNGETYSFTKWSDGGAISHTISVPNNDMAFTATYSQGNPAPTANILTPLSGTVYKGGETISYSGSGMDYNSQSLGAEAFTWKLEFHKPNGITNIWTRVGSASGSFAVPTSGETSTAVWYRLILTVKDAAGKTGTVSRDILPSISNVTLETQPAGLEVLVDSNPFTSPNTFQAVEGRYRAIAVSTPQSLNGVTYTFSHWIHGGNASQNVQIPGGNITYTAVFNSAALNPTAIIETPVAGTQYRGGTTMDYSGLGKNSNGDLLSSSAYSWKLQFHKPSGISNLWTRTGSTNGSFSIPSTGDTSTDVFYRLILTVTDEQGKATTTSIDIPPYKSNITLETQPSGLQVLLDSKPFTSPFAFEAVEGRVRTIGVTTSQSLNGTVYQFSHWSQGGNASQSIAIPTDDITYTAVFVAETSNPVPTIETPTAGMQYRGGQTFEYSGSGIDGEGTVLGAEAFTWKMEFHKPSGITAVWTRTGSQSGSFTVPTTGETSANVFYRLILTVRDVQGKTGTTFIDIPPYTSIVTLTTEPSGLIIELDSKPVVTPLSFEAVEGRKRTIRVVNPQTKDGVTYNFSHWLHGGGTYQSITVPADDITITAVYVASSSTARIGDVRANSDIVLYPNPSVDFVKVNFQAKKGEKLTMSLISNIGHEVKQISVVADNEGENSVNIDLSGINKNTYILKVQKSKTVFYKHLVMD